MRILVVAYFTPSYPHPFHHGNSLLLGFPFRYLLVFDQTLRDLFTHFNSRIKRTHRVLKDHANITPADALHLFLRFIGQVDPFK
ncbi:hypothetical protein D3C76_1734910 [compost metagenome]